MMISQNKNLRDLVSYIKEDIMYLEKPEQYESPLQAWWNKNLQPLIDGEPSAPKVVKIEVKEAPEFESQNWEYEFHLSDGKRVMAVF